MPEHTVLMIVRTIETTIEARLMTSCWSIPQVYVKGLHAGNPKRVQESPIASDVNAIVPGNQFAFLAKRVLRIGKNLPLAQHNYF